MNFAVIFQGWNLNESELVRSRLEAAGFHPILENEYTSGVFGGSANAIAPLRIQVPETEADDAREFLESK
jgi:Putative prokaryotic signal transducing protein